MSFIVLLVFEVIQFRFCHLPKKGEIVELHSMLLTISPFIFWDYSKTFSESILFLLVLAKKRNSRIAHAVLRNLSHLCLKTVVLLPIDVILTFFYWQSTNVLLLVLC